MTEFSNEQLFCSVDLEFTGFDPSRDQILEIGFAFFKVTSSGYEIVEEWSQVFKPSMEVHPKILGLTGITQEELDNAPEFNEHREFLQNKLGDAIIVGHNPVLDVKFLEGYGIKLSGKVIDTLELVQFILPTHHSYNLENLVHYFGVKYHNAHRALGDAISTAAVLENLVRVYQNFSDELKNELEKVLARDEFLWHGLLNAELDRKDLESNDSIRHSQHMISEESFLLTNIVTVDPVGFNHEARVAKGLREQKQQTILAVQDAGTVMRLWQNKLAHGVFKSDDTFSKLAFEKFLRNAQTRDELRFGLKIIVWLHTNWQHEVVFDLNISFFGGQFRQFIVGGKAELKDEQVIAVDYATLQSFVNSQVDVSNRQLVVCDLQNFEKYISSGFGTKLSWNNVLYSLRLIYNPESDFGNLSLKNEVISALAATDLFFGLVYMLLHQALPTNQYVTLEKLSNEYPHLFSKLEQAAGSLKERIVELTDQTQSGELARVASYLDDFFELSEGRVKWITVDEYNSSFHDQPIDIAANVQKIISPFQGTKFTDTITSTQLLNFLVDRLGLNTEKSEIAKKNLNTNIDLSEIESKLDPDDLYGMLKSLPLPLVIAMQEPSDIKEFYNDHYTEIKQTAALFAQGYSGGGNKMFRNFSINENSVLLVTADFMAKQNYFIIAKTIVFWGLPKVDSTHPYTAALLGHWKDVHPDLLSILSYSKIVGALKKLNLNQKILVKIFTKEKNSNFWG